MAIIAVEQSEGGITWTADGRTTHESTSMASLMACLEGPHAVVCEPAFYDGLRDVRRHLEELFVARGHRLVPIGRDTMAGLGAIGEDDVDCDVRRLFSIAAAGSGRLDRLAATSDNRWDVRDAVDVLHAIDTVHATAWVFELAVEAVGPYGALTEPLAAALGDGHGYRVDVLLAAYRAATVAASRDEFERVLGLTARATVR